MNNHKKTDQNQEILIALYPNQLKNIDSELLEKICDVMITKKIISSKIKLFLSKIEYADNSNNSITTIPNQTNNLFDQIISLEDYTRKNIEYIFKVTNRNN